MIRAVVPNQSIAV